MSVSAMVSPASFLRKRVERQINSITLELAQIDADLTIYARRRVSCGMTNSGEPAPTTSESQLRTNKKDLQERLAKLKSRQEKNYSRSSRGYVGSGVRSF